MHEYRFCRREGAQERQTQPNSDKGILFLLNSEEQILQSISARAPLPEILNRICDALDCQIGNLVSYVSLAEGDANDVTAMATHAEHFGLHQFCSERVFANDADILGSLESFCSVPRTPTASEFQLIERAKCLAAIAIKLDKEADQSGDRGVCAIRPLRGSDIERPVFVN
jgi:hypothetical protein